MKRLSFCFLLSAFCSLSAQTLQIPYTADTGLRFQGVGIGDVIELPDGKYRFYYGSMTRGLVAADSTDGLLFDSGQETHLQASDPSLVKLQDGTYRMYYKTNAVGDYAPIYSASSTDGINWKEEGLRYENLGEPCRGFTSVPDAVILPDGRVRVYFVCGSGYPPAVRSIVSTDGLHFSLDEGVRLSPAADPTVLAMPDGTLRMYYASPGLDPTAPPIAIGTAVSSDGLSWTVEGEVISAAALRDQFSGARATMDPAAIRLRDGRMRVYFQLLTSGGQDGIASVTSSFPRRRRAVRR